VTHTSAMTSLADVYEDTRRIVSAPLQGRTTPKRRDVLLDLAIEWRARACALRALGRSHLQGRLQRHREMVALPRLLTEPPGFPNVGE
jgi:hypothetical protein